MAKQGGKEALPPSILAPCRPLLYPLMPPQRVSRMVLTRQTALQVCMQYGNFNIRHQQMQRSPCVRHAATATSRTLGSGGTRVAGYGNRRTSGTLSYHPGHLMSGVVLVKCVIWSSSPAGLCTQPSNQRPCSTVPSLLAGLGCTLMRMNPSTSLAKS